MHPPQYCPHVLDLQDRTYKLEGEPSQISQQNPDHPVDLRHIVVSKKTCKSKSVSQSKGKRTRNPRHDTLRVEQEPECS